MTQEPSFFQNRAAFRKWLRANHARERELIVGFYKKGSGKPSVTWDEAVEEALCFGWIDGVRRTLDSNSYTGRFTPRQARSRWSAVNIARAKELLAAGRMAPAGKRALAQADERAAATAYRERHESVLTRAQEMEFRANPAAWRWFSEQTPAYRKAAAHWVVSAKKEETRARRLQQLIEDATAGRRVKPLARR